MHRGATRTGPALIRPQEPGRRRRSLTADEDCLVLNGGSDAVRRTRFESTTRRPGPPRVLVVDDDPAIRLVCSTNLQLDGYQVLEAANGQEGLELALDHVPDVVLLEISMPVLDGFGLAAALQANEAPASYR